MVELDLEYVENWSLGRDISDHLQDLPRGAAPPWCLLSRVGLASARSGPITAPLTR